jgi:hypothetical protein
VLVAQGEGRNELITPAHLPESLEDFALLTRFIFEAATKLGVPPQDTAWFVDRLLTLLTSCDERRLGQWELQSWWRFVDADRRSPAFQKFLADGLTRTLVAAKAHEMSARTGGLDPAAADLRPHARRRARGPRARRAHQRRLDRPVGGASRRAGGRVPPRRAGPGHPDGGRARDRRDRSAARP